MSKIKFITRINLRNSHIRADLLRLSKDGVHSSFHALNAKHMFGDACKEIGN
jgi:hypothetical protein